MAKAKKATATKTWGWGVMTPKGKLVKEAFSDKESAAGWKQWQDNAEQFKVVKVWIVPVK